MNFQTERATNRGLIVLPVLLNRRKSHPIHSLITRIRTFFAQKSKWRFSFWSSPSMWILLAAISILASCSSGSQKNQPIDPEVLESHIQLLKYRIELESLDPQNFKLADPSLYNDSENKTLCAINELLLLESKNELPSHKPDQDSIEVLALSVQNNFVRASTYFWYNYMFHRDSLSIEWLDSISTILDPKPVSHALLLTQIEDVKFTLIESDASDNTELLMRERILELARPSQDSGLLSLAFFELGSYWSLKGENTKTLLFLDSSIGFTPKKDTLGTIRTAVGRIQVLWNLGNVDAAKGVKNKMNHYLSSTANWQIKASIANLNGVYYSIIRQLDSSTFYNKMAYQLESQFGKSDNHLSLANLNLNIAKGYYFMGEVDSSQLYINNARSITSQVQNLLAQTHAHVLYHQSALDMIKNQPEQAIKNINAGIAISSKHELYGDARKGCLGLSSVYRRLNKPDNALHALSRAMALDDSIFAKTSMKFEAMIQVQDQNALQKNDIHTMELDALKTKTKTRWTYALLGMSVLTLLLAVTLVRINLLKRQRKLTNMVEKQKLALTEKEKTIANFDKEITQIEVHSLVRERKRIATQLHDGLLSELAALVNWTKNNTLQENLEPNEMNVSEVSNSIYENARHMLHRLQEPIQNDDDGTLFTLQISEFVQSFVKPFDIDCDVKFKDLTAMNALPTNKQINLLYMCKEVLANTLKHSKAKSVSFNSWVESPNLYIAYKDDGVGFDQNALPNGLGLRSIQDRVDKIGASVKIESVIGQGTSYIFKIPA